MRKKTTIAITSIFGLFFLVKGLFWLAGISILLLASYKLLLWGISQIKINFIRKFLKGLISFVFIFSIAIGIKLLAFDIYKIPSSSMENTLYTGDVILVNKLTYGPKLPRSPFEIPWVNIAFYLNKKMRATMGTDWWDFKRLSGTTKIKKGDIFVFDMEFSKDNTMTIVKRCMGTPGVSLEIKKGTVFINRKLFEASRKVKNNYQFKVENKKSFYKKLDSLEVNISLSRILKRRNWSKASLSTKEKNQLENLNLIDSVQIILDTVSIKSNVYPHSKYNTWNWDNYGPLKIPYKGMKINLTKENHALYKSIINKYEGSKIKKIKGDFYLDEKKTRTYIFKNNYYFMMGDNRKGSIDARAWGLIPEKFIVGKVQCVLFSSQYGEFQWDRFFLPTQD